MRELVFGTILVAAAGAGVYFMPIGSFGASAVPTYPLTVAQARARLAHADLRKGKEPFGTLDLLVTAPQNNVIRYEATGSFAALDCRATLSPEGSDKVSVATSCDRHAASDGAAASVSEDLTELGFAEFVDAALDERPFNEDKMRAQSAGAVLHRLPQMQRDALKMQRDTQKGLNSMDNEDEAAPGDDGAADTTDSESN